MTRTKPGIRKSLLLAIAAVTITTLMSYAPGLYNPSEILTGKEIRTDGNYMLFKTLFDLPFLFMIIHCIRIIASKSDKPDRHEAIQ